MDPLILAEAIGRTVAGFQATESDLDDPARLAEALRVEVIGTLLGRGEATEGLEEGLLSAPFVHLPGVFNAEGLPPSPEGFVPVPSCRATLHARMACLALHGLMGLETVSYGTENDGALFVNLGVIPGTGIYAVKSTGSMKGHTDAVSFPFRGAGYEDLPDIAPSPDTVCLAALRNPDQVPTNVMRLEDILDRLSPAQIAELRKPAFNIRSQKTFVPGMQAILGSELIRQNAPILIEVGEQTWVRYSHSNVGHRKERGRGTQAVDAFEAACNEVAVPLVLAPGDLLLINNRITLHGRGVVGGHAGGDSRWLLRTYGLETVDVPNTQRYDDTHVLRP